MRFYVVAVMYWKLTTSSALQLEHVMFLQCNDGWQEDCSLCSQLSELMVHFPPMFLQISFKWPSNAEALRGQWRWWLQTELKLKSMTRICIPVGQSYCGDIQCRTGFRLHENVLWFNHSMFIQMWPKFLHGKSCLTHSYYLWPCTCIDILSYLNVFVF